MLRKWMVGLVPVAAAAALLVGTRPGNSEINQVESMAPDVYFHEGELAKNGHCNNGWVVLDDYVLVIDANFPSGAELIIPKIKAITNKPIRFAFDTHHHGDHAYGNQVWVDNGAVPVANTGVLEEMQKYEPKRWDELAKTRPDVAASKLKAPTLLFPRQLIFDDGKHRVELRYLGVAHTRGDGFAWLPKEKILFTGDACVNGPYNSMGDGDSGEWLKTLEAAQRLGATRIGPGHGPLASGTLLIDQRAYFLALREQAKQRLDAGKTPDQMQAAVEEIRAALKARAQIARYVADKGGALDMFAAQVEKVYVEQGGKPFRPAAARRDDHSHHAAAHGLELLRFDLPPARPRLARSGR